MKCLRLFLAGAWLLVLAGAAAAADAPPLLAARGTVDKVARNALTVRPRGPDGRFDRAITLKLTGTSKVATLQLRSDKKVVVAQKETDPRSLVAGQDIALVYTAVKNDLILLTAVVHPAPGK